MPCGVGGGTHRSWPGGRGGRPRALIPGEGERLGGHSPELTGGQGKGSGGVQGLRFWGEGRLAWCTGGQGGGARARGGVQGLRFRGGRW